MLGQQMSHFSSPQFCTVVPPPPALQACIFLKKIACTFNNN